MGVSATLNNQRVTSARIAIPAWGCWYADVEIDSEQTLKGAVTLKAADLTMQGTILSGGASTGRSNFRVVAGGGGWGKILPKKSYATDAGVKQSTILVDAANEAGEKIDASTIPSDRVGPNFARVKGAASRSLEILAKGSWYVGEDGITRIGKRPAAPIGVKVTHGPVDRARGTVTLASDTIATILPGVTVDGFEAVDVEHSISKDGLRSTVWGARGTGSSRRRTAFRRLIDALYPQLAFMGVWEYRVVTQEGKRLNLQPVRVSTGMPDLRRVTVRPGIAGYDAQLAPGARVLVEFIDQQPSRPAVIAVEDAEGGGFIPLMTQINAAILKLGPVGARPVAAAGDLAGGIWPIVPTQAQVLV